jgi:hypothetical protein
MRNITLQSISVLADGGPHDGHLVLADGHLAAVLARVTAEETAGGRGQPTGWFLEAGFGPCGSLMSVRPPVFASLDQALEWVRARLDAGLSGV